MINSPRKLDLTATCLKCMSKYKFLMQFELCICSEASYYICLKRSQYTIIASNIFSFVCVYWDKNTWSDMYPLNICIMTWQNIRKCRQCGKSHSIELADLCNWLISYSWNCVHFDWWLTSSLTRNILFINIQLCFWNLHYLSYISKILPHFFSRIDLIPSV